MKWRLAWIALIPAYVLLFGWCIYTEYVGLVLARSTGAGLEIIAPSRNLLAVLWPLIVAGVLIGAIPAWAFIVWLFLKAQETDDNDECQRLETALQEAQQQAAQAQVQVSEHSPYPGREWALNQREAAIVQVGAKLQQREQHAEHTRQEALRQIAIAQARIQAAEQRAQQATHAFQRMNRQTRLRLPAQTTPPHS